VIEVVTGREIHPGTLLPLAKTVILPGWPTLIEMAIGDLDFKPFTFPESDTEVCEGGV
jgi:hypothetical protein